MKNNFEIDDFENNDKFLWSIIALIICFAAGTVCAIIAAIYLLFFR